MNSDLNQLPPLMSDSPQLKKRKMDLEDDSETLAPATKLLIKRLSDKAKLPTRGSALAAGYDLYRFGSRFIYWRVK